MQPAPAFEDFSAARDAGMEYMLTVGRRQPMHAAHLKTIERIMEEGFTPIVVIGSTNGAKKANGFDDPLFEPVSNPMTAAEQYEQLRRALPGKVEGRDYLVAELPDVGNNDLWCRQLVELLKGQLEINGKYPDISGKTAFHFMGKPQDKRPRRLKLQDGSEQEVLAYFWEGILDQLGLPVVSEPLFYELPDHLSATYLRDLDLNALSSAERDLFAAPDYIVARANQARQNNPFRDALKDAPVTLFDLSLDRLQREKHISTFDVLEQAEGETTLPDLKEAARALNKSMKREETVRLKIASASLNQTVYDFATNVPNIFAAIDRAVEDGADILALEELGLSGYAADDYHQWFKSNDQVWPAIQKIAHYAYAKNPNLVISLGTPFHFSDKDRSARDPLYNINDRPFNTQMTITQGKVVAVSAKSILADGPAEYEPHQFRAWPDDGRVETILLPDGSRVPFGKPVLALEDREGRRISLFTEQCAEAWPGVADDLTINAREQMQARHLVPLSRTHDLSVVLNPSASKPQPAIDKEVLRAKGLCETGSKYCGVYVYTNYLGSNSGTYAAEGSQIFAQDGKIVHHGARYAFGNVSYSSAVLDVPMSERGEVHASAKHAFTRHERGNVGAEVAFEPLPAEQKAIEEYARSISLWLRDYMEKQAWPCQGFVISLSGGKDSAYGAVAVSLMVDQEIREHGVEGFFRRFDRLQWKDEALAVYSEKGEEATADVIKKNLLTCIYLPSDNSSDRTQNAARFLIEGGALPDGSRVKGIGGSFTVHNVQGIVDAIIFSESGIDFSAMKPGERREAEDTIRAYVKGDINELPASIYGLCSQPIPTYNNPSDDITLQNIQARARLPLPWTIANKQGKLALVTSNESEATLGYTTAGGDMHMGGANPIGGMPKDDITRSLAYFEEHGLAGVRGPIRSLHYVNIEKPSAELRPETQGVQQTDESDLGFSYAQSKRMEDVWIEGRNQPGSVFAALKNDPLFPNEATALRDIMARFRRKWESAQFKRVMSTLAPYVGDNVDPHQSVRTTVLGDHFKTGMAQLTLDVMADAMGPRELEQGLGESLLQAKEHAMLCKQFKLALLHPSIETLMKPEGLALLRDALEQDRKVTDQLDLADSTVVARVARSPVRQKALAMGEMV